MTRAVAVFKAFLCAMLVGVAADSAIARSLGPDQVADLAYEGNELFGRANRLAAHQPEKAKELYHKAVLRFERIVRDGGVHNGKLYYNIGNGYFRMGDLGRAILNYRRAERLIPNDANLQQNLTYARSKCLDKIEQEQRSKVLHTVLFWHYDLATKTRLALFALFSAALWTAASVRLFARPPGLGWVLGISAAVAVLLLGSLLIESLAAARNVQGVIVADEVVARKGDGEAFQRSFQAPLHAGTEFTLVEYRRDWYHVELSDGRRCWLPADAVAIVP